MIYAHFKLRYENDPEPKNAWNKQAWFSYVGDKKISKIDADDKGWFELFRFLGIPGGTFVRLREYKNLLGRISYHHADDSGKEWGLVPSIKEKATTLAVELVAEYPNLDSVIANLREGELL